GGLQFFIGLRQLRYRRLARAIEFAHGFGVFRQRFLGGLGELVFQKQVARRLGRLHFQPGVFVGDFVAFLIDLGDKTFFKQPPGSFQSRLGLAQFLSRHLQVVLELAELLLRFAVAQRLDLRVFGEINHYGRGRRVGGRRSFRIGRLPGLLGPGAWFGRRLWRRRGGR